MKSGTIIIIIKSNVFSVSSVNLALNMCVVSGLERSEVLSLIQTRLSQCDQRLPPCHHATMYDFMVQNYIHHQCLYQAFLKGELNPKCMYSHLDIHVPPRPLPLSEGTELGVWEKRQALKKLTAAETVKLAEIQRLKKQAEVQIMEKLQVSLSDLSLEDRLEKQVLVLLKL